MNSAAGTLEMASSMHCSNKFRQRKLRVGNRCCHLPISRSSTQQHKPQHKGRDSRGNEDPDVWDSCFSAFKDTSMILIQNSKAGENSKLACLLNVINQQVLFQSRLWSSQLEFPTKDGYRPLRQIQARRLRLLLALAYHLDEKDRRSHRRASSLNDDSSDGTRHLQAELQQMSLAE